MFSSIAYLTRQAGFKQVNEAFPVTETAPGLPDAATFEGNVLGKIVHLAIQLIRPLLPANKAELVTDFMRKAKQIEYLISVLPSPTEDEAADKEFTELEAELQDVNREYKEAIATAGSSLPPTPRLLQSHG
jgi:mediator of RNA polymerase II transcription subunit 21